MPDPNVNLWRSPEHAMQYLQRSGGIPHREQGEAVLLDCLPETVRRVLDLGTGDGRLLGIVKTAFPDVQAVAIDFSPVMLDKVRERFADHSSVSVICHNLDAPLPEIGTFDAVVSSFAIHHLHHNRKRELYAEVFARLRSGGVFCNLEHVASPSSALHGRFLASLGVTAEDEDPSNKLLAMETQLIWLRDIGFMNVDCLWKWRELALLVGSKPVAR